MAVLCAVNQCAVMGVVNSNPANICTAILLLIGISQENKNDTTTHREMHLFTWTCIVALAFKWRHGTCGSKRTFNSTQAVVSQHLRIWKNWVFQFLTSSLFSSFYNYSFSKSETKVVLFGKASDSGRSYSKLPNQALMCWSNADYKSKIIY